MRINARLIFLFGLLISLLLLPDNGISQLIEDWRVDFPDEVDDAWELEVTPWGPIMISLDFMIHAYSDAGDFLTTYDYFGTYMEALPHGYLMSAIGFTGYGPINLFSGNMPWQFMEMDRGPLVYHPLGGFYYANTIWINSQQDRLVGYLNNMGEMQWEHVYELEPGHQPVSGALGTESGNIFVFYSHKDDVDTLFVIEKYNMAGTFIDSTEYDSPSGTVAYARYTEPDGYLFIGGRINLEPDTIHDMVRFNQDGEIVQFGPPATDRPRWGLFSPMSDGGYVTARADRQEPEQTFIIGRFDASLNLLWEDEYYHPNQLGSGASATQLGVTTNDEIVVLDDYSYQEYLFNVFLVKFESVPTDLMLKIQPQNDPYIFDAPRLMRYGARLSNITGSDIVTDVWIIARGPNGYPSQPIHVWEDVTVPALGSIEGVLRQYVPEGVEAGPYNYIVRTGDYPNPAIQDYFSFTVTNGPETDPNPTRGHGVVEAFLPAPEWQVRPERVRSK